MKAVVGLLLMVLRVSHGVESHCDGRLGGAQCYGVLGGTVVFQLMDDASKIPSYKWVKEGTVILKGRKDKILVNSMESRSLFIPSNGTFLMNNLISTDFGEYTFMVFDSDGKKTGSKTLQLSVESKQDPSLLRCGLMAVVAFVSFTGIGVYFKWKKRKYEKAEESAAAHRREHSEEFSETELRTFSDP